jgi:hypothetical protein
MSEFVVTDEELGDLRGKVVIITGMFLILDL